MAEPHRVQTRGLSQLLASAQGLLRKHPLGAQARLSGKGCRPGDQPHPRVRKALQNLGQEVGRGEELGVDRDRAMKEMIVVDR